MLYNLNKKFANCNQESKEVPSEKTTTTKSFEERQGIEKCGAVCSLPQMANESNTLKSFRGVQDRDKEGVFGETKIQHAEKMNKTDEKLQSQERGKSKKVYATYADAVKVNTSTKRVREQEINENIAEKDFEGEKEQPQVSVVHMVKESLDKEAFEGEKEQPQVSVMQMVKEPLNKAAESGINVLGAVGETVAEIGENMMKPAEKVREKNEEGKGGGVLSAIGETVAEIAQTAKVIAVGEGDTESKQRIESEAL
ncbi:seed biotin-containing protein SBP65-like [Trifolium medium]|uniref:Seed biotin-containing protein SBP65-like n=1 Tax=Trifolium medium TaxID=97028 RepID=A0A392NFD2_9FABA|nr:seed biotin-containing protein SBP65-like [Trifolium medium]